MNANMVKPEKFANLYLVYHFTVPLEEFYHIVPKCNLVFSRDCSIDKLCWVSGDYMNI